MHWLHKKGLACFNHPVQATWQMCGVQFCFHICSEMYNMDGGKKKKCPIACIVHSCLYRSALRVSKGTDKDGHYMTLVRERVTIYLVINVWCFPVLTGYLRELIYQCLSYPYVQIRKSKTNVTNLGPFTSKLKCGDR